EHADELGVAAAGLYEEAGVTTVEPRGERGARVAAAGDSADGVPRKAGGGVDSRIRAIIGYAIVVTVEVGKIVNDDRVGEGVVDGEGAHSRDDAKGGKGVTAGASRDEL